MKKIYLIKIERIDNIGFLESLKISLVGRNLVFFKNDAPFDPDVTFSTGVGLQGLDIFSLPSTRQLGFNLTIGFCIFCKIKLISIKQND